MKDAPKSLRLQIGIFGRTNVGKSSFLNMVAGQDYAITSPVPGTTTDVVEKTMELLPVGPVVFLDTAGVDDASVLAEARLNKTRKIFDRSDVIVLISEAGVWTEYEKRICGEAQQRKTPLILVINKIDQHQPNEHYLVTAREISPYVLCCSSIDWARRDRYVNRLKEFLLQAAPDDFINPPILISDLIPKGGIAFLIIPIDFEAPKGRIILPQVQVIRDALDHDSAALIAKESEYQMMLARMKRKPDLVICDSQVVDKMVAQTPPDVKCTTFSIIFARYKGDLAEMERGARTIETLRNGDRVLIAESCSHHPIEGDIGRVKIPQWLKKYTKADLVVDSCAGRDYPEDLKKYKLIIHCGSCMLTRREMLFRIQRANEAGVPITNYGVAISFLQGVLDRVLEPFPMASMQ